MLAKIREYSARLSRIIVLLFNTMIKAQFYCIKAGDDLYFAIFLPKTRNGVYRRIFADFGRRIFSAQCTMTIFGQCYNVLN